jgi:hypothetical protein
LAFPRKGDSHFWLAELIRELRGRLLIDPVSLGAAPFLFGSWVDLDPRVESLLAHG